MIDYEKLKIAHELTRNLPFESYSFDCWCYTGNESGYFYTLTFEDDEGLTNEHESEYIDELIIILTQLTEPQQKYKDAWYVSDRGFAQRTKVHNHMGFSMCEETAYEAAGKQMYESKDALIEDQLEYWNILKLRESLEIKDTGCETNISTVGECQHESDGELVFDPDDKNFTMDLKHCFKLKCKKCGDFYR